MTTQGFPFTVYTDSSGNALRNGYILIDISNDVQSPTGQLCRGMTFRGQLDSNGNLINVPNVWPNAALTPGGSCYLVRAYEANGQLVLIQTVIVQAGTLGFGQAFGSSFGS